jgi:hypothetical protein
MAVNPAGYRQSLQSTPSGWLYNYYNKARQNGSYIALNLFTHSFDGGNNLQSSALGYSDKTGWRGATFANYSHATGQHIGVGMGGQSMSLGDFIGRRTVVVCNGGFTSEGDTGCRAEDNFSVQGNVEYSGSLTGGPSPGATTLTVNPTQGAATQGAGRFLIKTNGGTISSGTVSAISTFSFSAPTTITGANTNWPTSTVIATLGTNVSAPGVNNVTPSGFTAGSIAGIQTGTLVCVADASEFEMVLPTAVTATTFTATFAKPHPATATISVGGLCGYGLDLAADNVTDSTFTVKSQTIVGTLHPVWPVMASASPTSLTLWVSGDGVWQALTSRWNPSTANGYVLYPIAEVTSAQSGGGISNTLTLAPNNVAWAAGDQVSETLYPAVHFHFGFNIVESYFPNIGGSRGFNLQYNQPLQGNDTMLSLLNNTPSSMYLSSGGPYFTPRGIHLNGAVSQSLTIDNPPDIAAIAIKCGPTCGGIRPIIAAGNSIYFDFLYYDQTAQHFDLTAYVVNARYSFAGNRFDPPFSNVYFASDANKTGFAATTQLRSGTASNSDLTGELTFTNATTMQQSLQGQYASHPECVARPQFDSGATNRHWITYSGSTFTINFAAPVSGIVSYSCIGRDSATPPSAAALHGTSK